MSDDADPDVAFARLMEQPATRGEVMHLARLTSMAFLAQGLVNVSLIDGDEDMQRRNGEQAIEQAGLILEGMRKLMDSWKADHA